MRDGHLVVTSLQMTASRFIFSVFCILGIAVLGFLFAFFSNHGLWTLLFADRPVWVETILFAGFLLTGIVALFGPAIRSWWRR